MNAQCYQTKLEFQPSGRRAVTAKFDSEQISSDGGALLLREVDRRIGLTDRLADCFIDYRNPASVRHHVKALLRQRIYGITMGYEDLNDHEHLSDDRLMGVMVDRLEQMVDQGQALASPSTLNRLELGHPDEAANDRYKRIVAIGEAMDRLLADLFMESFEAPPKELWLDLDATDDPLHGEQEGRFFHGYYDCYCYLPLYIFCGEQLLCSRLRTSDQDGAAGSVEELERIVGQLRARWPKVRVVIRGDSGFCREDIMAWCEQEEVQVDYVIGVARNSRLEAVLSKEMEEAAEEHERTGEAVRRFGEFSYQTRSSWSRARRVIGKAEHLRRGANPRFVVTSLSAEEVNAQELYEEKYCARGDMENRIKEQQLDLFADRTSSHQMAANQLRLYFASFAYGLLEALRRLGAKGTRLARAQSGTLRLKLIKVGVRLRVTTRRVWLSMSAGYPHAEVFAEVLGNLGQLPLWRPPPDFS